jgi:hypothetical protein
VYYQLLIQGVGYEDITYAEEIHRSASLKIFILSTWNNQEQLRQGSNPSLKEMIFLSRHWRRVPFIHRTSP